MDPPTIFAFIFAILLFCARIFTEKYKIFIQVRMDPERNPTPTRETPAPTVPTATPPLVGPLNQNALPFVPANQNPPTVPAEMPSGGSLSELDSQETTSDSVDGSQNTLLELLSSVPMLRHKGSSLVPAADQIMAKTTLALQKHPLELPAVMGEVAIWKRHLPTSQNFVQESICAESAVGERLHQLNINYFGDSERFGSFIMDSDVTREAPSFDTENHVHHNSLDLAYNRLSGPMYVIGRIADYLICNAPSPTNQKWQNRLVRVIMKLCRVHTTNLILRKTSTIADVMKTYNKGEKLVNEVVLDSADLAPSEKIDISMILTLEHGFPLVLVRLAVFHEDADMNVTVNSVATNEPVIDAVSDAEEDSVSLNTRSRKNLQKEVEKLEKRLSAVERQLNKKNQRGTRSGDGRRSRSRSPVQPKRNFERAAMRKSRYAK